MQDWLINYVATLMDISAEDIDVNMPFSSYGLNSAAMVVLRGDLVTHLNVKLDPTLLYEYPTIRALVTYLEQELG
jgi:acyl carrier protein